MKLIIVFFSAVVLAAALYVLTAMPGTPRLASGRAADSLSALLAGCWRFEGSRIARYGRAELIVRLDSAASPRRPARRTLVVLDSVLNRGFRLRWWTPTAGRREVAIYWGTGHTGLDIRADLRDNELIGLAYPTSDFRNIFEERPSRVRATRTPCPP